MNKQTIAMCMSMMCFLLGCGVNGDRLGTLATVTNEGSSALPSDVRTWEESDGVIVVEAEKGVAETSDTWAVRTDYSDYYGTAFIRWEGNEYLHDKTHGVLVYKIKINNPGTYHMVLRSLHDPDVRGNRSDEENDCWTNTHINGTEYYKTFRTGSLKGDWNTWTRWETSHGVFEAPSYHLTAGEHTFRIAARAKHYMLDRIYFLKDLADLDEDAVESSNLVAAPIGVSHVSWHQPALAVSAVINPMRGDQ